MDISTDINIFDNYKAVDFYYIHQAHTYTIHGVKCNIFEKEGAASQGVYRKYYTYFRFSLDQMTAVPALGDIINDTDGNWTVLEIDVHQWNGGYGIKAVNLNLYNYLEDTISIYTGDFGSDAWAERTNNPIATIINLSARIQPIESHQKDLAGHRGTQRMYNIYIEYDHDISYGSYILDQNGNTYLFKGMTSRKTLDNFAVIQAVKNE